MSPDRFKLLVIHILICITLSKELCFICFQRPNLKLWVPNLGTLNIFVD
jgi:hypothetical protein